jgi:sugar phosphate isomerase/epimerase
MIIGGLVSISFRKLSVREVLELVNKSDINAIEWGGDSHVPHGDLSTAKETRVMCGDFAVETAAYGSYYRVGESESAGLSFNSVLDSALELGAPTIRVWAGSKASADAEEKYRAQVAADARRIADMAQGSGVEIAFEYHCNTLTDTNESAQKFLKETDHKNIFSYWQPPIPMDFQERIQGLEAVLEMGKLSNLHVYQWEKKDDGIQRLPLSCGAEDWKRYFKLAGNSGKRFFAMLEFVRDDDPAAFLEDAATLADLLAEND